MTAMIFDTEMLLYGTVFVGTLLLIEGIYYLFMEMRGGSQRALNRRMRMLAKGSDSQAILRTLRRDSHGPLSGILARALPSLDKMMGQAGVTASLSRLLLVVVVLCLAIFAVIEIMTASILVVSIVLSVLLSISLTFLYLMFKRKNRLKRFGDQLPNALDLIVRSLRAGHPVSAALDLVSKESPDPAGSEFGIVVDEMTYGLDIHEALKNLADRVPYDDLRFVVVTVQIQYMVGGNLSEVLGNLATVIRDRRQMFAKIRAISAEGRFSAIIVGILPFAVAGIVHLTAPKYFTSVMGDPMFWPLIGIGGVLLVLGHITIYRMVNFRV